MGEFTVKFKRFFAGLAIVAVFTSMVPLLAAASSATPGVTLTATSGGSATAVTEGGTIDYVASLGGNGAMSLAGSMQSGQTIVPGSVAAPSGWTDSSTSTSLAVSGTLSATPGTFQGATKNVSAATVNTANSGGDGFIPIPYGNKVFGAFHYTLDGNYDGGDPVVWSIDKATGALTHYTMGMGSRFQTSWIATPQQVGSKLYVPGVRYASTPTLEVATNAEYGFGCFDMATQAPCATNWYKVGNIAGVTPHLSKGSSGIQLYPLMSLNGLGAADSSTYKLTVVESTGANPVLKNISFASGAPVVSSTLPMNISEMMSQNTDRSGSRIYTTQDGSNSLFCTDTTTGGNCAGWTNPTAIVANGVSSRVVPVDGLNAICVEDTAAKTYKCADMTTGALIATAPLGTTQVASNENWDATGTRQYFGPAYGSGNTQLRCIDSSGAPCAGFGTAGLATVASPVTDYKTYGFYPDDQIPSCMWMLGDGGQLYPFNAVTGAPG